MVGSPACRLHTESSRPTRAYRSTRMRRYVKLPRSSARHRTIASSAYSEKYSTNRNMVEIDIRKNDPRISSLISIKIKFRIFNYKTSLPKFNYGCARENYVIRRVFLLERRRLIKGKLKTLEHPFASFVSQAVLSTFLTFAVQTAADSSESQQR